MAFVLLLPSVPAANPYPPAPPGVDPRDYASYLFIPEGAAYPGDYVSSGDRWKYSSERSGDPVVDADPRELFGVTGMSVDLAWRVSTGRPDVVIAVLDSGIRWGTAELATKIALNAGELPFPHGAARHDRNGDGSFDPRDYAGDPRVRDSNGNGFLDGQDLIRAFSDGTDADGNGYVDDVAGWDALDDDNDAHDDTNYGHGTGEAKDSVGEADNGMEFVGTCPNCKYLPVRVGLSFVAHDNDYAAGVLFAVAAGAHVIQEALGTTDNTRFAQEAARWAWLNGVPVIASAADEESYHHNYPAAHAHAIVANSVRRFDDNVIAPKSHLFLNGCTNYGSDVALSFSSTSCSSEATGRAAGIAGLLVSHALNQIDRGNLTRYPLDDGTRAPYALSANEVRQLLTMTADDVDFSLSPQIVAKIPTKRFPSAPGWDPYFGYGRANVARALDRIDAHRIPPEAEVLAPDMWAILDARGPPVEILGLAAAQRESGFDFRVEYGCGEVPPLWWALAKGKGVAALRDAKLATLDPAQVALRCGHDPHPQRPTPQSFHVAIRLTVTDPHGNVGEHRRTVFVLHDPSWHPGFPWRTGASGEASPRITDLDGDGVPELLYATSDGEVHAWSLGAGAAREVPGWPVRTGSLPQHDLAAFRSGVVSPDVRDAVSAGGLAVGDLDGDGRPEVAATTLAGFVHVWEADGAPRAGWPKRTDPAYSSRDVRDDRNTVLPGIQASPVLEDLDGDGRLEVIVAAMDRHVYVWRDDGTPLPGFPALVVDRSKVQSIDPVTHRIRYRPDAGAARWGQILSTPAVADLDGDGRPEILVGTNEQYREKPDWSLTSATAAALAELGAETGNGRLHALDATGRGMPGWPAKVGLLVIDLLPYVGEGVPGSPAVADVDADGSPEVAIFSTAGPGYLFRADGSPYFGRGPDGGALTFPTDVRAAGSAALDLPTFPALGSGLFARLLPSGPLAYAAPAAGLGRFLDVGYVEDQPNSEDHVMAWSAGTAVPLPGFPAVTDDLMFLTNPTAVDVDGDLQLEILSGSGGYLVHAFKPGGLDAAGFPKFTGGWVIGSPATGDVDGDGLLEVAVLTREGWLFVWDALGPRDARADWWSAHHDERNTGNFATPRPSGAGAPLSGAAPPGGWLAFGLLPLALLGLRRRA